MAYLTDGRIVKNFSLWEMTNKQAKDEVKLTLTPEVVEHAQMMQELREWFGKSMTVNSWYRTKAFNKSVGGHVKSCHLDGLATDINMQGLTKVQAELYSDVWRCICIAHGKIGGVSIYIKRGFMHFDSDSGRYGTKTFRKQYF